MARGAPWRALFGPHHERARIIARSFRPPAHGVPAYRPLAALPDGVTPSVTIDDIGAKTSPEVATALRGRRVTAATWALAYGLILWGVLLVPYRRGERWAWWTILLSLVVSQLVSLARIPMLELWEDAAARAAAELGEERRGAKRLLETKEFFLFTRVETEAMIKRWQEHRRTLG